MQHLFDSYPFLLLAPMVFVWCGAGFLVSQLTGWAALSRRFRATSLPPQQVWNFQTARMRWSTRYGNCLTVGADPAGLYLCTFFLLRIGHPPLLLPWHEVSIRPRGKTLFGRRVQLQLGREEQIPLTITGRLADRIQAAAGQKWPVEATT